MHWTLGCTAGLALALFTATAGAQQVAGQVLWASGPVTGSAASEPGRALAKGDAVYEGDTIATGSDGYAQLLMKDRGLIALRPQTSLHLATYAYQGRDDGSERAVMRLMKGGLRSITGAVGASNKDHYLLRARTVLVGIRGTDHETFIAADESVYNRVSVGGTYLQGAGGRIDLDAGQVGHAPLDAPPSLLERTPEFMQLTKVALPAGAPFNEGVIAHGRRTLPEHVSMPALPQPALSAGTRVQGWAATESLGKGVGKALGKAQHKQP